ncbi:MAG: hypothetical protein ACR2M0_08105 [Chloroflexia bacterium]
MATQNEPDEAGFADLDPPPPPARRWPAILVGLALVALLLFALADWWQQNREATAYRAGVGEVAARHWAEAKADFTDAAGFSDAPALVLSATTQLGRLEDGYRRMTAATQAGDLLGAWQQARAVAGIQPDYRDIATRLDAAHRALFTQGLAGVVYLQTSGPQPGLHVIRPNGSPAYLPGTDRRSRVHTVAPDGRSFLYDVRLASGQRRLAVAGLRDGPPPAFAALPASFDPQAEGLFTAGGEIWASSGGGRTEELYDPALATVAAKLRIPDGAVVLGASPDGSGLLLARSVPGATGAFSTTLILAAHEGAPLPAFALPGFLLTGDLSPDGRYATVLTEEAGAAITRTLYLIDLAAPRRPPQELDRIAWQGITSAAQMRTTWLPGTPTGGLVLEHKDASGLTIFRYTLPSLVRSSVWAGHDVFQRDEQAALCPNGGALALRVQLDDRDYLAWVPLAGPSAFTLPFKFIDGQLAEPAFAPRGAYLIYSVRNPSGLDQGTTDTLYSLPVPPDGTAPRLLARATRMYDSRLPTYALAASGAMAAFVASGGDLHARTLDGSADKVFAHGVAAVWALAAR